MNTITWTPTSIPCVWKLIETWPNELREYIAGNCSALDLRRTYVSIYVKHDTFLIADFCARVLKHDGATKEITDYGNCNFTFPGEIEIRFVV